MRVCRLLKADLVLDMQPTRGSAQLPDNEAIDNDGAEFDQEDPKVMICQPLAFEFGIDPALASCTSVQGFR
jgi:hypothetical protein